MNRSTLIVLVLLVIAAGASLTFVIGERPSESEKFTAFANKFVKEWNIAATGIWGGRVSSKITDIRHVSTDSVMHPKQWVIEGDDYGVHTDHWTFRFYWDGKRWAAVPEAGSGVIDGLAEDVQKAH